MTIEEKAKAYDKVIERAIKHLDKDGLTLEQYETIDIILPELKESEDEKIRQELISFFTERAKHTEDSTFNGLSSKKIISWLKKQDEKIDAIENFDTEFEKQVSRLIASAISKEHEYNEGFVKWTANALLNYAKHELEKQNEQKPAEWSKEDEEMYNKTIKYIKQVYYSEKIVIDWFKSLKDRVQFQNIITDEELAQAKKDSYNDTLDKIEYNSGEPTFDDG